MRGWEVAFLTTALSSLRCIYKAITTIASGLKVNAVSTRAAFVELLEIIAGVFTFTF